MGHFTIETAEFAEKGKVAAQEPEISPGAKAFEKHLVLNALTLGIEHFAILCGLIV